MASVQSTTIDVRKFQFDEFEGDNGAEEISIVAVPDATYSQSDLETAMRAAQEDAYAKGKADSEASIEGDIQRLMAGIADAAEAAVAEQRALQDTIGGDAIRLAASIARKVLPAMAESGALTEIETLIQRCLSDRPEESRLVVRINDAMLDKIEERLAKIVTSTGFAGKPILLADPAMNKCEVRIEWANGGVDWSFSRQMADIEAACQALVKRPTVKVYDLPAHDDSQMSEIMDAEIVDEPAPETEKAGE